VRGQACLWRWADAPFAFLSEVMAFFRGFLSFFLFFFFFLSLCDLTWTLLLCLGHPTGVPFLRLVMS